MIDVSWNSVVYLYNPEKDLGIKPNLFALTVIGRFKCSPTVCMCGHVCYMETDVCCSCRGSGDYRCPIGKRNMK